MFLAFATASLVWPQATGHLSTQAVVNAPLHTIRTPIDGSVKSSSPGFASPVRQDSEIVELEANRASRAEVQRLNARQTALRAQIDAMIQEENMMLEFLDEMRADVATTQALHISYLSIEIRQAQANRAEHAVNLERITEAQIRLEQLAERNVASQFALREAELDGVVVEAIVRADEAIIAALELERIAVSNGVLSPRGVRRADYYYERMDEIGLRLADLRTRRQTALGELASVEQLHAALSAQEEMLNRFRPTAAVDGLIWTASSEVGTDVAAGDDIVQLLDCQNRFIEASFSESAFENLSPGMVASVRLRGSTKSIEAVIIARHAVGGGTNSAIEGAVTDRTLREGVTVYLNLAPTDIADPEVASSFCDVGRTAEVHIPSDRLRLGSLSSWVRAFIGIPPDPATEQQTNIAANETGAGIATLTRPTAR